MIKANWDCNREIKLLKLKANYNYGFITSPIRHYCNREIKLLKLKANYNQIVVIDQDITL